MYEVIDTKTEKVVAVTCGNADRRKDVAKAISDGDLHGFKFPEGREVFGRMTTFRVRRILG